MHVKYPEEATRYNERKRKRSRVVATTLLKNSLIHLIDRQLIILKMHSLAQFGCFVVYNWFLMLFIHVPFRVHAVLFFSFFLIKWWTMSLLKNISSARSLDLKCTKERFVTKNNFFYYYYFELISVVGCFWSFFDNAILLKQIN